SPASRKSVKRSSSSPATQSATWAELPSYEPPPGSSVCLCRAKSCRRFSTRPSADIPSLRRPLAIAVRHFLVFDLTDEIVNLFAYNNKYILQNDKLLLTYGH